jgi:hypothetical protein
VRVLLTRPQVATPSSSRDPTAATKHEPPPSSSGPRSPRPNGDSSALFEAFVGRTGLSELLSRSAVESVCRRIGVSPAELTPRDVPRLVEELERTLRLFLLPRDADARIAELGSLSEPG